MTLRDTLLLAVPLLLGAQELPTGEAKPGSELYAEIEQLDRRLFQAFNQCELAVFTALLDPAVEFYHDQGGLTQGGAEMARQVKANICGKVRRELVAGSLRVYPMHGFGALFLGRHRFFGTDGVEPTGVAQFIHLARKEAGGWKLVRILSFDHMALR